MSYDVSLSCTCCGSDLWTDNHTSNQAPLWAWALGESLGLLIEEAKCAGDLVEPLRAAIQKCERHENLSEFDSPNGWGSGVSGVAFLRSILAACREHTKASVRVWR